jgi:hypothetical protein
LPSASADGQKGKTKSDKRTDKKRYPATLRKSTACVRTNSGAEPVGYEWKYMAKVENLTQEGDRIEVFASDLPGNISENTKEL